MTGEPDVTHGAPARSGSRRRIGPFLLALAAPVLHLGCFASGALDAMKSEPAGTLELVSTSLGDHTLAPSACVSGERQMFLGADFPDAAQGITARLIVEPSGSATLRVFPAAHPLDAGLLFQRQDCDRFELSLEHTGWQINEVYDLSVRLDVDCRGSSGDSVRGVLAAGHCH